MRIFLLIMLFLGISATVAGQDNDESKVYQVQTIVSYHQVSKGETLQKIARLNEVSIDDLKCWNDLNSSNVAAGSVLKIQKIEYVLAEKTELPEPQLLTISTDENLAANIFESYLEKVGESPIRDLPDHEDAFKQIQLLSIANNIEYRIQSSKKKNILNNISNKANDALHAAKNWGRLVVDKIIPRKDIQPEVFYANNIEPQKEPQAESIKEEKASSRFVTLGMVSDMESGINKEDILNNVNTRKVYHKVKIGETMTQIATRYNVTKEDIMLWNNLESGIAKVKQRLLIYTPVTLSSAL